MKETTPSPSLPASMQDGSKIYRQLARDSWKAASVENGLQYSAIYWETGHRTWLTFFQPICHKFTWKLIDDTIRRVFRFTPPVTDTAFVFFDEQVRLRYRQRGAGDDPTVVSVSRTPIFSFHPMASSKVAHPPRSVVPSTA